MHDDLVRRQFSAVGPNAVWLTDITEHPTAQGKLYLCAIKDLHSNRIVGYSLDSRMTASLAVAALRNAIGLRSPTDTIVHSDRGSQFRSCTFVNTLSVNGLRGSMGRVGGRDTAAMESFFALLQKNVLDQQRWPPGRATTPSDRHLDREDLPPRTPPTTTRPPHPDRV